MSNLLLLPYSPVFGFFRTATYLPLNDTANAPDSHTSEYNYSEICHGKPCIRGLRYPVELILELLSSGMTADEILADYEDLERADIFAALAFATR